MTTLEKIVTAFLMAMIVVIASTIAMRLVRADDLSTSTRSEFFKNAKRAKLVGGGTFNCCDPAEAVRVRITGMVGTQFRAIVIDPMRHRVAKVGQEIFVSRNRLVVWPAPPSDMGDIIFLASGGGYSYCFFPQPGG